MDLSSKPKTITELVKEGSIDDLEGSNDLLTWTNLECKSRYRFWNDREIIQYNQMKEKYLMEERPTTSYTSNINAQELISRYLRPLKYRTSDDKHNDGNSTADQKSKCDVGVILPSDWWKKLPQLSSEDLYQHCWKCCNLGGVLMEAEFNFDTMMTDRVEKKLKSLIQRWTKDKSFWAFVSIHGNVFRRKIKA